VKANESIQISAKAGAMPGNAASRKQPSFEQFSLANMVHSIGRNDLAIAVR
jgi:hypothetical protein